MKKKIISMAIIAMFLTVSFTTFSAFGKVNYNPDPEVKITAPRSAYFYMCGNRVGAPNLKIPIIIGYVGIDVRTDKDFEYVEIYIDEELKETLDRPLIKEDEYDIYQWIWSEPSFGRSTIKALAYVNAENSNFDEQEVYRYSFGIV